MSVSFYSWNEYLHSLPDSFYLPFYPLYDHACRQKAYLMSSANPNAAVGSGGYAAGAGGYQPKKKRNKWLWIGLPVLLICIILAAVLGGVLGSRANNDKSGSSTSSDSSAATTGSSNVNTGLPSGVTSANNAATNTGANGEEYLAVATDTYMLPVYATGVSSFTCATAALR